MIRAAWITTGFSKDEKDTGGAAAIHNLARELSLSEDIELTIFSFYYPFSQPEYKFYDAKVFSFAGEGLHRKMGKPGIWRKCIRKFGEEHEKKRFDVIHSMWAGESGNIAAKLSKKHNIPLTINICGGELAEIKEINYGSRLKCWQKKFVDYSIDSADKIIAGSDYVVEKIEKYYGSDAMNKTTKIPFGADEKVFYSYKKYDENKKNSLINIANALPVKSHETLFKAIKIVSQMIPNIKLKIYGMDEEGLLIKRARKNGVEKNVEVHNFIEHDEIAEALNQSGIFVLSSLYESQNMSIIEAAFCGLPVVSTDAGAAREITQHIVKPGDYEGLSDEIISVIDNYKEEVIQSQKKIQSLKEKYSLKSTTNKFLEIYKQLSA